MNKESNNEKKSFKNTKKINKFVEKSHEEFQELRFADLTRP